MNVQGNMNAQVGEKHKLKKNEKNAVTHLDVSYHHDVCGTGLCRDRRYF